jgi:aspartyl-tRNA(Asn)/glutamyl-tRNA(Gln) amidotransferase subunit A
VDYVNAQRARRGFVQEFKSLFESIDCLFTPTTPITAPAIGQASVTVNGNSEDARLASTRLVRGINAIGNPAISLPCGEADGLPVGLQIIGRPFDDALVLQVAAVIEKKLGTNAADGRS